MEEILEKLRQRVNNATGIIGRSIWELQALKESLEKSLSNTEGVKGEIDEQILQIRCQLEMALSALTSENL